MTLKHQSVTCDLEETSMQRTFFHSVEEDWCLQRLTKRYSNQQAMSREWQALTACAGVYVQKALEFDSDKKVMHLVYEQQAKPLSRFEFQDAETFVGMLPIIIRAIHHCHQCGWVHGDIKPSNILFLPHLDSILLIDFGASYPLGTRREDLTCWQASQTFASSEQWRGEGVVTQADDWHALKQMINQFVRSPIGHKQRKTAVSIRESLDGWLRRSEMAKPTHNNN